jgi:hypothetical protein
MEVKEQYQVKISNRTAALENLNDDDDDDDDDDDINKAFESMTENIKASVIECPINIYVLQQQRSWINGAYSK